MWQHIFKFKLFHVQYFNGLWTKTSLSFFVIIMTMSRSAGRCQSRSNLLIAKLRVATRETSQVSLSSSSPSSLPNQSVHHQKANSLHRHCPKRRAPRPYQHQTQHHCHLGLLEGVSSFSYISAIVFGVSIIWKDQWGREARRRVKCGECPLVVAGPPWSQPLQEVNDTKSPRSRKLTSNRYFES